MCLENARNGTVQRALYSPLCGIGSVRWGECYFLPTRLNNMNGLADNRYISIDSLGLWSFAYLRALRFKDQKTTLESVLHSDLALDLVITNK